MKLLSYDTSSDALSAALYEDGRRLAGFHAASFVRHSSGLVPALDRFLARKRTRLRDIDCLAISLGPGSFTGLRVGVTTAKVLAYALNLKVVGISSLEAMAFGIPGWNGPIAVLLDARKGKLYAAIYERNGKIFKTVLAPKLVELEDLVTRVKRPTLFVGDAVPVYRERLTGELGERFLSHGSKTIPAPLAESIAKIAFRLIREGKFQDPFALEPLYLHPRDCNVMVRPTYGAKRRQVGHAPSSRGGATQRQRGISVSAYGAKS